MNLAQKETASKFVLFIEHLWQNTRAKISCLQTSWTTFKTIHRKCINKCRESKHYTNSVSLWESAIDWQAPSESKIQYRNIVPAVDTWWHKHCLKSLLKDIVRSVDGHSNSVHTPVAHNMHIDSGIGFNKGEKTPSAIWGGGWLNFLARRIVTGTFPTLHDSSALKLTRTR